MKQQKAFTLIELLVVIAIVGLLASIVLVATSGVRGKARIAKLQEFSQSIQHALGANAVGIWSFNEGVGITAKDSSGYGNDGTIHNATYVDGISGTALKFNGTGEYVKTSAMSSNLNAGSYTVEWWVYPWDFGYKDWAGISLGTWYQAGFAFTPTRFITYDGAILSRNYTPNWQAWQHLVVVHDLTTKTFKFYRNGVSLASDLVYVGTLPSSNKIITIAGRGTLELEHGIKALIDEVRIYSQALTIGQIQQHYAEGLTRHQNLAKQ